MQTEQIRLKKKRVIRDLSIIVISIIIAIYIQASPTVSRNLIDYFSGLYFVPAAFLMGFFFALTFTAAIATSVFITLAQTGNNPFLIAFLGGFGSVLANSIIYKFFKEEIIDDIKFLEPQYAKRIANKIFHSKLFIGLIPYICALLLASPLPDEVGILILAGSNYRYIHFFLLSFGLHTLGILLIVLLGKAII